MFLCSSIQLLSVRTYVRDMSHANERRLPFLLFPLTSPSPSHKSESMIASTLLAALLLGVLQGHAYQINMYDHGECVNGRWIDPAMDIRNGRAPGAFRVDTTISLSQASLNCS